MRKAISMLIGFAIGTSSLTLVYSASKEVIKVIKNQCSIETNGKLVNSDNFLYNNRIYVPLRAVSESFSMEVEWDDKNKAVKIYNEDYDKTLNVANNEFSYNNIGFSMSPEEVVKVLGEPLSIKKNDENHLISLYYNYTDFKVGFSKIVHEKDEVYSIEINSKNYKTDKGIKIGDTLIDVIKKYGKPHYGEPEYIGYSNHNCLVYLDNVREHAIEFFFDNEKRVTNITIIDRLVG